MDKELSILTLAALFHNIGKFARHAGRPFSPHVERHDRTNSAPSPPFCFHTDYFLRNDLPLPSALEADRSRIARIATAPHSPDETCLSEMCLLVANQLSSGADATQAGEESPETDQQSRLLLSVFDEVTLSKHAFTPPGSAFYDLAALDAGGKNAFPHPEKTEASLQDYDRLFKGFLSALSQIRTGLDFHFYLDTIISVLEKYTWCVPAAAGETLPDVPLFDHGFSTAGIAQALFCFHKAEGGIPRPGDEDNKFILLGGDLSGIQKYIFEISRNTGRGVSKIFRARSFFLQALTRSVLFEIRRRLDLFPVCRLIDSGGKFIFLLPATQAIFDDLEQLDETLQIWFRKKFKGLLNVALAWDTQMQHHDFQLENFQSKIDAVYESLEVSKYRKLNKTFASMGTVIDEGYEEFEDGNCQLCNVNAADAAATERYKKMEWRDDEEDAGESVAVCADCARQITYTGTRLPRAKYLIYNTVPRGSEDNIPLFGNLYLTLSESPPADLKDVAHVESLENTGNFTRVRMARYLPRVTREELDDPNWLRLFSQEGVQPKQATNQSKTFSMIALKSKKAREGRLVGRGLLGFFKADVDNLGLIFSLGLEGRLSLARFAAVSRMLNIFFSEYLVTLVEKEFPDIYVVFAGGDDLFLVGPWHQTLRLAIRTRQEFSRFCANNPDISLSGGIFAAKPRFPMRKAVEKAEQLLEEAKGVQEPRTKDSVCFLGESVSWEELDTLLRLGEKLDKAVEERDRTHFTTAFLYRLLTYHRMYRDFIHGRNIRSGRFLSLAYYDIGRNIRDGKGLNQKELGMLYEIFAADTRTLPLLERLDIPLFYAINLNRESE